jgi:hypothetical protein
VIRPVSHGQGLFLHNASLTFRENPFGDFNLLQSAFPIVVAKRLSNRWSSSQGKRILFEWLVAIPDIHRSSLLELEEIGSQRRLRES